MKILGVSILALGMLAGTFAPASASEATLRQEARAAAKKYLASHDTVAVHPSVRVSFAKGLVQTKIYGKLYAKGAGGVGIVTTTRFPLFQATFKAKGNSITQQGRWKALAHPEF